MAKSRTTSVQGIPERIIVGDNGVKVDGTFSIELTQNSDGTGNYIINGYVADPGQVQELKLFLQDVPVGSAVVP